MVEKPPRKKSFIEEYTMELKSESTKDSSQPQLKQPKPRRSIDSLNVQNKLEFITASTTEPPLHKNSNEIAL